MENKELNALPEETTKGLEHYGTLHEEDIWAVMPQIRRNEDISSKEQEALKVEEKVDEMLTNQFQENNEENNNLSR